MGAQLSNEAAYAKALFPDRWRVLGRWLQPLCLGHALLLQRYGSPFSIGAGRLPKAGELMLAVAICARPFAEARALAFSGRLARRLVWWGKWVQLRWPHPTWLIEAGKFRDYFQEGWNGPKLWTKDENAPMGGAPLLTILRTVLTGECGRTTEDALATPLAVALWEVSTVAERVGKAKIYSDGDASFTEHALAIARDWRNGLNGENEKAESRK